MTRIAVRLTPRARRNAIEGWEGDVLLVRIAAPPVDGKANAALLRLIAKALHVPPSRLTLVSGVQSRVKMIEIAEMTLDEVRGALSSS